MPGRRPRAIDALAFDSDAAVDTLPNGLTTIVRHNDRPGGEVQLRLVVDAGSMLEEPDAAGVAHFLEHMMFNGTAKYPKNELTAALQHFGTQFGADVNAATTYDDTVYELTVPNDDRAVSTAVDILHEWLTAATLDDADVTAERGVVLDEWRQSSESAAGRTFAQFADALLAGSPYAGRDPIGTDTAIEAMTPAPLRRFYDRWYRPDNATVIVVGDVDVADVRRQLADVFDTATPRSTVRSTGRRRLGRRRHRRRRWCTSIPICRRRPSSSPSSSRTPAPRRGHRRPPPTSATTRSTG